jgi:hypothetical protein
VESKVAKVASISEGMAGATAEVMPFEPAASEKETFSATGSDETALGAVVSNETAFRARMIEKTELSAGVMEVAKEIGAETSDEIRFGAAVKVKAVFDAAESDERAAHAVR